MKIYTKIGDSGTTSLFGGRRVEKNSARVEAYGSVDELNSLIGVILSESPQFDISKKLLRIQGELFVLGSDLATPIDLSTSLKLRGASKIPRVSKSHVSRLEKEVDLWEKDLPKIKNFVLPGGSKISSKLHLARAIARRAERSIVNLASEEKINKNAISYINRLSDWLFELARYINKLDKISENLWKGRGN